MTLFEDTDAPYSDSNTTTLTEPQPTPTEVQAAPAEPPSAEPESHAQSAETGAAGETHAPGEDFASVLDSFTAEAAEAASDDHVLKGTVLKLTATHVVVDIGAKSEGMLPLAEVLDHEGKPKVKPGDEIDVMRDKGQAEEGYIILSHQKAARLHAWDEVEKAHHEKRPIKARVIQRTKGGLKVDI